MNMINLCELKTLCLITGASSGFGRQIALDFSKIFPAGSVFILIARNKLQLDEVKLNIYNNRGDDIKVFTYSLDLSSAINFKEVILKDILQQNEIMSGIEQAMLINNAGSLGPVDKYVLELNEWEILSDYYKLNVTSVIVLTSAFFDIFKDLKHVKHTVVNISSLAALQSFKSWSIYCSGKAARDVIFKTLAAENPVMRVLSYAPGPLDTNMWKQVCSLTRDDEVRASFQNVQDSNQVLSCEDSVKRLIILLEINEFESGAHIDYYDVNDE